MLVQLKPTSTNYCFAQRLREKTRDMHLFHLAPNLLHHLLRRQIGIGEPSAGVTMTAILARLSSVGLGSATLFIFRQRHPATLTIRTFRHEHVPSGGRYFTPLFAYQGRSMPIGPPTLS